jgi:hypothetical protein
MMTYAVITADMVNSTLFPREAATQWLHQLNDTLSSTAAFEWVLKPEIYRGDSFQGVLGNTEEVMKLAVLARSLMRSNDIRTDLRIAIGIGSTDKLTDRPGTSDGEAFRLSGHLADNIRKQKARIAIAAKVPTGSLAASLDLLEVIIENWTIAQSEVAAALLQNESIKSISERLSISQSAVSQRIASSKWWAVESFLNAFPQHLALYATERS